MARAWLKALGPVPMTSLQFEGIPLIATRYFNWNLPSSVDYRAQFYTVGDKLYALLTQKGEPPIQAEVSLRVVAFNDSVTTASLYLFATDGKHWYSIRGWSTRGRGVYFTAREADPQVVKKFINFASKTEPETEPEPESIEPEDSLPAEALQLIGKSKILSAAAALIRAGYSFDVVIAELSKRFKPSTISHSMKKLQKLYQLLA